MTGKSIAALLRDVGQLLQQAHISGSRRETQLLVCHALGINPLELISGSSRDVSVGKLELMDKLVARRLAGEPVGRIIGAKEIYDLQFEFSTGTLEPRDDTETLIDAVLTDIEQGENKSPKILELGTGSGVIVISLLKNLPHASAIASDISADAIRSAYSNSIRHNVDERLLIVNADWSTGIKGKFDIIVSNPPYIRSDIIPTLSREVREHDPMLALDGGDDGLDAYRCIFSQCRDKLTLNGKLYLEIGYDQGLAIRDLGFGYGWSSLKILNDLSGNSRVGVFELPNEVA